mgnify:CR=1 FL=1
MSNFDKERNRIVTLKEYAEQTANEAEFFNNMEYIENLQSELDYLDQKIIIEDYRRELGNLHYKYSELWDTNRELEKQIAKINKGENSENK